MKVIINGAPRQLPAPAHVHDAVEASGAAPGGVGVAVALDGEVVPRGEWERRPLQDGQRVEVVQAVQGG